MGRTKGCAAAIVETSPIIVSAFPHVCERWRGFINFNEIFLTLVSGQWRIFDLGPWGPNPHVCVQKKVRALYLLLYVCIYKINYNCKKCSDKKDVTIAKQI